MEKESYFSLLEAAFAEASKEMSISEKGRHCLAPICVGILTWDVINVPGIDAVALRPRVQVLLADGTCEANGMEAIGKLLHEGVLKQLSAAATDPALLEKLRAAYEESRPVSDDFVDAFVTGGPSKKEH